ncbi:MAG: guanylate kinase [Deltaproteobacteria bacterium]|nr:MAG: guanylate kinase [Deltaproteobacteria bacterium]
MKKSGLLLPIAAPSGTGKTTVCRELLAREPRCRFSISATTRPPRPNERDGVDYHFLSRSQFEKYIREQRLAEYEEVFGNYYGTLQSSLEEALQENLILLLDIDVKGALTIKRLYPDWTCSIFLLPPNRQELLRRLRGRGTDDPATIELRNARIPEELKHSEQFDYQIVNDKLDDTVNRILTIIKEYTHV